MRYLNSSGGGIAAPLDANYYKGCGLRQGIEREFVVIVNESISDNYGGIMREQPPWELHGTGCIQRHVPGDREE